MEEERKMFNPAEKPTKKVEDTQSIASSTKKDGRMYADYQFKPGNTAQNLADFIKESAPQSKGLVPSWSASMLKKFETCRWQVYLNKVLKLPTEQGPAAERGERWHAACELYVMGEIGEWPEDMASSTKFAHFADDFDELRDAYAEACVEVEGNWGFNQDWDAVEWMAPDVWARMKLDVKYEYSPTHIRIIDHKTGKKFGNEVTHADQGLIYTIGAFMRYPEVELIDVDFWYLDQGEKSFPKRYSRAQAMVFLPRITDRALRLTTATERDFRPSPSIHNCRYCDFNKEGACEYRVNR